MRDGYKSRSDSNLVERDRVSPYRQKISNNSDDIAGFKNTEERDRKPEKIRGDRDIERDIIDRGQERESIDRGIERDRNLDRDIRDRNLERDRERGVRDRFRDKEYDRDRYAYRDRRDIPHHNNYRGDRYRNDRGDDRRKAFSGSRSRSPKYYKKSSRENSAENLESTCVYVTNLSDKIKEYHLEDAFKKFGNLKDIKIVRDPFTKASRGFAFITFETRQSADEAITQMNGFILKEKRINCEIAKRNRGRASTPGVYLGPSSIKRQRSRFDRPRFPRSRSRSSERRRYRKYEPRRSRSRRSFSQRSNSRR